MSGAQFTKGPWQRKTVYPFKPDCVTIVANVDGDTDASGSTTYSYDFIATCEDEFGGYSDNAVANAHLIAAAPELYSALAKATELLQMAGFSTLEMRTALAKARGEQP